MKKISVLLAIIMIAGSFAGKAQIQRGNVLVGGDLADFNLGFGDNSEFSMDINPKAAWFIRDNTAVGAYVRLALATQTGSGTAVGYGFGALARKYMSGTALEVLRHTRFFLEGNLGIEGQNASKSGGNKSTNGLGLGVGPGLAYFVTPNIGLEGLLKYNGIFGFGSEGTQSGLNLNVGFQIYLPGRTAIRNVKRDVQ